MARSLKKGFFLPKFFVAKSLDFKTSGFKFFSRNVPLTTTFLGKIIYVYNGKTFKPVDVTRRTLGQRFGEFSVTRVPLVPKRKKKQKNKKKK